MNLNFIKMSGSGNDFIFVDNRKGLVDSTDREGLSALAVKLCARGTGVGADGLVLIEDDPEVDFKWVFYNSDGSEAEMCGNASRCAARLAFEWGLAGEELSFRTVAGIIHARVGGRRVKVELTGPFDLRPRIVTALDDRFVEAGFINTGVPHVVIFLDDVESVDLKNEAPRIRYHQDFAPAGTNVNYVQVIGPDSLLVRTYERGVEGETLACGTGVTASALISSLRGFTASPTRIRVRSGEELIVHFDPNPEETDPWPGRVYFEGITTKVYEGRLGKEAME